MRSISILFIAKELPFYDRSSGNFRLYQIIRILASQGHSIAFLARPSFRDIDDSPYILELEQLGVTVYKISDENEFILGTEHQNSLRSLLLRNTFDIAYLMFYSIAELYLEHIRAYSPKTRIIVDSVDIHFLREQRQYRIEATGQKNVNTVNKARELNVYSKADLVIVLTDVDQEVLLTEVPQLNTAIVPNIHPSVISTSLSLETRRDIVFVGGYTHEPNIDAVEHYCNDIWPIVASQLPECRLIIAGNAPPHRVSCFASERILVTGFVQDLSALLSHCRVAIAPLRFGAGMKGKVGEALAHGLPVVATSIAAEGMGLVHGEHLLIADSPRDFASSVACLYQDSTLWKRLSVNGRAVIEHFFSPEAVSGALTSMLNSLLPFEATSINDQLHELAERTGIITPANAICFVPGRCNICGSSDVGFTIDLSKDEFINLKGIAWVDAIHNRINLRENIICRNCPCNSRHRALISIFLETLGKGSVLADVPSDQLVIFESSGMASYNNILASKFSYINTTYSKDVIDTGKYDAHQYADLQQLPYADNTFNYILTGDVLEHVRDYSVAITECFRVLKPGGYMIFTVPYNHSTVKNHIKVLPDGDNDIFLEEPEFHGKSRSLVYRVYGRELLEDLVDTGFSAERKIVESREFGIYPTEVFICRKPEKLSDNGNVCTACSTTIAIKCCTPSRKAFGWGDTYFAVALAQGFKHLGYDCRVDCRDEWYTKTETDIVIHLKGRYNYTPTVSSHNIIWIISHPELVTIEELNNFDLVFCASESFSEKISDVCQPPVYYLPQASDPNIFKPVHQPHKEIDLLFVGNNYDAPNGGCRKIIADLKRTGKKYNLLIIGENWRGVVDDACILARFIEPEQLPLIYSKAKVVLNDHHPAMKQEGFINNRTFDLALSKVFQISDPVDGLDKLSVISYESPEDLRNKIDFYLDNSTARELTASMVHDKCRSYTFENRATEIIKYTHSRKENPSRLPCSPSISILIPTYNRARYLADAISSALTQDHENFEVVVVDDGSGDNTADIVRAINNPKLRYVIKEHSGAPATRNRCVEEAKGDFVLWLDSDDVLLPGVVSHYVKMLKSFPDVDIVYGDLIVTDQSLNPLKDEKFNDWYGCQGNLISHLLMHSPVPNPGTLVRKSLYSLVGQYNTTFRRAHDYEWWVRSASHASFKHAGVQVVKWRWHDSNMSSGTVKIDTSFEVRIVESVLNRFTLQTLFPDIDWTDGNRDRGEALAYLEVSKRFLQLEAFEQALCYAHKAFALLPDVRIINMIHHISSIIQKSIEDRPDFPTGHHAFTTNSSALRILLVAHNFPPHWFGGVEIYTFHLAKALLDTGISVAVLYPLYCNGAVEPYIKSGSYEGVQVYQLLSEINHYDLSSQISNQDLEQVFKTFLQQHQFNVVHFHHTYDLSFSFLEIAREMAAFVCVTLHDFWYLCPNVHLHHAQSNSLCAGPASCSRCTDCYSAKFNFNLSLNDHATLENWIGLRLSKAISTLEGVGCIVASSRFLADVYSRFGLKKPIEISPLGLVPLRKSRRKTGSKVVFGFLGAIHDLKNTGLLVEAFKEVKGEGQLVLYGIGIPQNIQKLESNIQGDKRIEYRGGYHPEQLADILEQVDVVVVPSISESYSLVVREALYAGVPVIASRVGGIPEIVTHLHNGILFDPANKEELRCWLQAINDDPALLETLKLNIGPIKTMKQDADEWLARYKGMGIESCVQDNEGKANNSLSSTINALLEMVSIIIPVFNQVNFTAHCLKSLYENTPKEPAFEVIIVDNASTDGTQVFLNDAALCYPNLRIIRNDHNMLYAKACNQGAQAARGRILVFLNNDTLSEPQWLEWLIAPLLKPNNIGIVGAKLLYPDRTLQHGGIEFVALDSNADSVFVAHRFRGTDENDPRINNPEEVQAVTGACFAMTRELFSEVGGISEDYGMYYEDIDLCLKVRMSGKKIYYEPRSVLIHYEGKSSDSRETLIKLDAQARKIFLNQWRDQLLPLALKNNSSPSVETYNSKPSINQTSRVTHPLILIDGFVFQFRNTGIARVWLHLLTEWSTTDFASHILLLDRAGTAPKIPGIRSIMIPSIDIDQIEENRTMLQSFCDAEQAQLFISTYYTAPLTTPSVFMAYDMIPENTNLFDLNSPMWQVKHLGIRTAVSYIAISRSTARDLIAFYPDAAGNTTIAYCGVDRERFYPADQSAVDSFKKAYGITGPYLVFIGERRGYKNAQLLFKALGHMNEERKLEVVCIGGEQQIEAQFIQMAPDVTVHILRLGDSDLRAAYSGALALAYPTMYEGFGLPILEAMACNCPVIVCQNSSIPEVAGAAVLYVGADKPEEMAAALQNVQRPDIRQQLISMGQRQARKFSWSKMAQEVQKSLLNCSESNRQSS